MNGPSKSLTPPPANPPQAPSANAAGSIHLTPAEAQAYIEQNYRRLETALLLDLLGNYFGIRIETQRELSSVQGFLATLKKCERQLRAMKNKDLRNAGLRHSRSKIRQPCAPDPPPKRQAIALALWRAWFKKIGEPFPKEDRVQWAREQLRDEPNLSEIIRSGLDLE